MATLASGKLSELFEDFLKSATDRSGTHIYRTRISQLISSEGKSLPVDFGDLLKYNDDLANKILLEPDSTLAAFRIAAFETMRSENALYADRIKRDLVVRIRGISDLVPLRRVDTSYLDRMLGVSGMVVRTSELRPLMVQGAWICPSGHVTFQEQDDLALKRPPKCELCGEARNFELDRRHSRFVDFQILRIQELPEELPPGQLPQFFDVNVEGDIVNTARPGDRVVLTGIVRAVPDYSPGQLRTRLFRSQIDCSYVEVRGKEPEQVQITKQDEAMIKSIAKGEDAYEKLIASMAPVILGHEAEKEAILLLLVGGTSTILPDGTKLRGDVNILLVGDPGTAKSEMLKFTAQLAPRGLLASGRGTTAAGLSAAVIREKNVLMLEAGVVVLADQGIACLHPETEILFDKRLIPVSELAKRVKFETVYSGNQEFGVGVISGGVESLDLTELDMVTTATTLIRRKMYKGKIKVVKFKTGLSIRLTPDHMLLDGSTLMWKPTSDFVAGDYVTAPLTLPPAERDLWIWDIASDNIRVTLSVEESDELDQLLCKKSVTRPAFFPHGRHKVRFGQLKQLVRSLGVEEEWRKRCLQFGTVRSKTPVVSPEVAYLVGFVFGDGHVARPRKGHRFISVSQSDSHAAHRNRFIDAWEKAFDTPLTTNPLKTSSVIRGRRVDGTGATWSVSKRIFYEIYQYLTGEKLRRILLMPNGPLAAFTAGLIDSDGSKSEKTCTKNGRIYRNVDITLSISNDEQTNLNLALALRRFGCLAFVHDTGRNVFHVSFTSRRDCLLLQKATREFSVKMQSELPARIENMPGHSEMLPKSLACEIVSEAYSSVPRQPLIDRGVWSTVYSYMNAVRAPRVLQIQKLLERTGDLIEESYSEQLEALASRDYYLDEIISIKDESYEGYVYDLFVPRYHNFVANGIVVENCIDEFDKMRPEDRSALHEQMEQNVVTIAKGGIYASLNARTAILAAMNPVLGRYNPFQNLTDNIGNVPIPLLTRFDLIFVIKDQPSLGEDEKLASHILAVHTRKSYPRPPPVEFGLLKKYIAFSKKGTPTLTKEAVDRLRDYYLELRKGGGEEGQIPPTPRTLESLIRLATARAKLLLKEQVGEDDALAAMALMNRMVADVLTDATTRKTDFGIQLGKPAGETKTIRKAVEVFKSLEGPDKKPVERKAFKEELLKSRFTDEEAEKAIRTLFREGLIYESKPGFFRRVNV